MNNNEDVDAAAHAGGPSEHNISTDHQPKGSALNPSDTLDREGEEVEPGQRRWDDDSASKPSVGEAR